MDQYFLLIRDALLKWGWEAHVVDWLMFSMVLVAAVILFMVFNYIIGPTIERIARKTPTKIDDILFRKDVRVWIWWLIVGIFCDKYLPLALCDNYKIISTWIAKSMDVVNIAIGTKLAVEMLKGIFLVIFDRDKVEETADMIRKSFDNDEVEVDYKPSHSLHGLQQMLSIALIIVGGILIVSTLLGQSLGVIFTSLSAGAAILMLIFKDSILGVVAGIQLTINDMLRPGDWIIASKYGANGRVQEITLATVKVLNWDHTIVTIPPYNLISDSFQNWRKMEDSGGRRVTRSFFIDMTTVRFVSDEEVERFESQEWAKDIDWSERQVNLTVFRKYLEHYIQTRPTFRPNMLYMIRELPPTPEGLPIEMYFFTSETTWAKFELVQAAVLDHVLAVVNDFGLKLFQTPTGADVAKIAKC